MLSSVLLPFPLSRAQPVRLNPISPSASHLRSRAADHSLLCMASGARPSALVYSGEGAGQRSALSAIESLQHTLLGVKVCLIGSQELLQGTWTNGCLLLCMPGGADLPYCRTLNGDGNRIIREFVDSGGAYLGLCAGGYYGCARIEFEPGTPLEVKGDRELAFFPGLAKGAVYPGFTYQTEAGAHAAPLRSKIESEGVGTTVQLFRDYSNGGPAFIRDCSSAEASSRVTDLATYAQGDLGVAAVRCQVGQGVAVLCGTHPELDPRWLDGACDADATHEAQPDFSAAKVAELVANARHVRQSLAEDQRQRQKFWELLLLNAGLGPYLRTAKQSETTAKV